MKGAGFLLLVAVAVLGGCAGAKVSPALSGVRRVAVVGVAMNRDFANLTPVDRQKAEEKSGNFFREALRDSFEEEPLFDPRREEAQRQEILAAAWRAAEKELAALWQVASADPSVLGRKGAQMKSLWKERFDFSGRGVPLAVEDLAKVTYLFSKEKRDPRGEALAALSSLARELSVDAVVLVKLDVGYREVLSAHKNTLAKPSVGASMKAVDVRGELVFETTSFSRVEGGACSPLIRSNKLVDLEKECDAAAAFSPAAEGAVRAMARGAAKSLGKR